MADLYNRRMITSRSSLQRPLFLVAFALAALIAGCATKQPAPDAGPSATAVSASVEADSSVPAVTEYPEEMDVMAVESDTESEVSDEEGAQALLPVPETPQPPAKPKYNNEDVIWIQQRLKELGYYDGPADGSVGRATRHAIEAYQVDQGLEEDGRPTTELREFMWRNGG